MQNSLNEQILQNLWYLKMQEIHRYTKFRYIVPMCPILNQIYDIYQICENYQI